MVTDALVVGCDPSARRIALVAHHPVTRSFLLRAYDLYPKGSKQTTESLAVALDVLDDFLDAIRHLGTTRRYAWVENPLVGRGGTATTLKQAYVGGIIRASLVRGGFTVYGVNVSSWKKDVIGNWRAQKPQVARAVKQKWPKAAQHLGGDGDLTDAAAIALYGEQVLAKADLARSLAGPAEGGVP